MGRLSDRHVQLGEEGFQEGGWRLWLESRDRPNRTLQLGTGHDIAFEELSDGGSHHLGPRAVSPLVGFDEGRDSLGDAVLQGDMGEALASHGCATLTSPMRQGEPGWPSNGVNLMVGPTLGQSLRKRRVPK
jgi:hypothetical protein